MERDEDRILRLLAEADPAGGADPDEDASRERVRELTAARLAPPAQSGPRRFGRLGAIGATAVAIGAALVLFAGDRIGGGSSDALAITSGPDGVTLKITDPGATAEEMNQELSEAGIDRVRVFSVPGSPNHVGTWGGQIYLVSHCPGAPKSVGFGIRSPYRVIDAPPAPGRGFVDLNLPGQEALSSKPVISAGLTTHSGGSARAVVSSRAEEDDHAPAILIAIRARHGSDGEDAKEFGIDDLGALGGEFDRYADALSDGDATCEEMDFDPAPADSGPADAQVQDLLEGGPVIGRCVVRVLGTGLFSIDEKVSPAEARRIHECSAEIRRELRREHAELRAERAGQIERIDSEAELPAAVRAALGSNASSSVEENARGIDTGAVVMVDPDGHHHRTAPKRRGEYINLLCAARGGRDRELWATTYFAGEPVANARVSCRAHGPWRTNHVARLDELGLYEVHLNGAGFEDFLIRTRAVSRPSDAPSHRFDRER
jgi:hypothetical protein